MTTKEIEKFIKKNIIGQVDNTLLQKGAYILKHPVKDILGGFCFERSGIDKDSIYIWWFVQPLFIPDNMIGLTFGGRLEHLNRNQSWDNVNSLENTEEILNTIRKNIPLVESLTEPNFFYSYYLKYPRENIRIYEALIYTLIWRDTLSWKQEVENFIKYIDTKSDTSIPWIKQIKNDMKNIILSSNPNGILEENKRNQIKLLNL